MFKDWFTVNIVQEIKNLPKQAVLAKLNEPIKSRDRHSKTPTTCIKVLIVSSENASESCDKSIHFVNSRQNANAKKMDIKLMKIYVRQ